MTKVSMLWGQFINNSVTHNAYMYYYAQTLRFASVVCGAFTSSLQTRVTFCQWLIKESRWLLALELELRQSGISIGAESVPRTGYFAGAGFGNRVLVPELTLAGRTGEPAEPAKPNRLEKSLGQDPIRSALCPVDRVLS